jgi:ribosomal protein L11 methyltransferase
MDSFWLVTLFQFQGAKSELEQIEEQALQVFHASGIEEFALDEPAVDAILGERSYSGGDLPLEVLEEVEASVELSGKTSRFFFLQEADATGFYQWLRTRTLGEVQLEQCQQEDWNAEWKKHYAPIEVNEELEIVPAWMQQRPLGAKHRLLISPGMGFGTGSHETTFLCLKLMVERLGELKLARVLDFGSGSGILGLAIFLFSPEARVDFYDIDPEANKNCYQNAELNGFSESAFRLLLPAWREKLQPSYDLIFANILENVLLLEKSALTALLAPGGKLILSGILLPQEQGICEAYQAAGLHLIERKHKGDWSALLFEKRIS